MKKDLNENHVRVLKSGFDEIENVLHRFSSLLKRDETKRKDLSSIDDVTKSIESAHKVLGSVREKFGIRKSKKTDPMWIIRVGVARLWEMLEDMKSANLKGYGKISADMIPVLDEQVDKLIDAVEEIARAAERVGRDE